MIYRLLLFLLITYVSVNASRGNSKRGSTDSRITEKDSDSCKIDKKTIDNLDRSAKLLHNVRNSYPDYSLETPQTDCVDVLLSGFKKSGVYKVFPISRVLQNPIDVYCDMVTDGGGWTVIQRRGNYGRPKDAFYQDWETYKKGFGDVKKDFWLGNDNIFALSNQRLYSVRFDLEDVDGNRRFALYDTFYIDDENNDYTLHIDGYSGNAGDSMTEVHNGQKFSTKDKKNDNESVGNLSCAEKFKGGWWYNLCHDANLNGLYDNGKNTSYSEGVNWYTWKGYEESLKRTAIKIRRKDFRT